MFCRTHNDAAFWPVKFSMKSCYRAFSVQVAHSGPNCLVDLPSGLSPMCVKVTVIGAFSKLHVKPPFQSDATNRDRRHGDHCLSSSSFSYHALTPPLGAIRTQLLRIPISFRVSVSNQTSLPSVMELNPCKTWHVSIDNSSQGLEGPSQI
jgi:hypothetical protein